MTMLERVSNVSAIIACAVAMYLVVDLKLYRARGPQIPAARAASPVVGKRLDLPGADWPKHRLNLVVAMTTTCRFCVASLPFYERLSQAVNDQQPDISLRVASPEPTEVMKAFLKMNHVAPSSVLQISLASIGVVGTPTVVALDSRGTVTRVFRGLLDSSGEREVLALVRTAVTQ